MNNEDESNYTISEFDYNKRFDDKEAPPILDDQVHISPWLETNRHENLVGIQFSMNFETFGKLIKKLKFWK